MNHQQRAEEVVQGWITRLVASPLYRKIYGDCECNEWEECSHKQPNVSELDVSAAQENADSIMLSELGKALNGDYGLARETLNIIKAKFIKICKNFDPTAGDIDIVTKVHEIEVEEIIKALKSTSNG